MNLSECDRLSRDLVFRALDDELTAAERFACESHLDSCQACREKLGSLRKFSLEIDAAVDSMPVPQ